jgi:type 1 glutamine amidotransferase
MKTLLAFSFLLASLTAVSAAENPEPPAGAKPNVLLVTGQDGPWHEWRKTAPVLAALLEQDPRLHVRTVQDPAFLADPSIQQYDVIVLHFVNWEVPSPSKAARENFKKYLTGGKGVMLVHFACGAWQDWPEFRGLVARVWDPKLRPHDPRGPFAVTIASLQHPIVAGLKPFQADDELYTCLTGDRPIEVLAQARSKVDGKLYPMAFAYPSGKGRVFQCLLGHDVKAMQMPGVGELYRRGCAWAAGLPPVKP